MKKLLWGLISVILISAASYWTQSGSIGKPASADLKDAKDAITLVFPKERYPETGDHIQTAIEHGKSAICTIDRAEAEHHRDLSLKGVPTKKGYDRDEWPMAMCAEGGSGADIRYVAPADNRGAGSWISNQLDKYPDGTRVKFIVK